MGRMTSRGKGLGTSSAQLAGRSDYAVLLAPVITEKSSVVGSSGRTVVFKVAPDANKIEIRSAVERIYKVTVTGIRTVNVKGKMKRSARSMSKRSDVKKAYVTLAEGQTINVVEGL